MKGKKSAKNGDEYVEWFVGGLRQHLHTEFLLLHVQFLLKTRGNIHKAGVLCMFWILILCQE